MAYRYDSLNELRRKKELLQNEVKDLEKLLTFDNTKQTLSALTNGLTDTYLKEVPDADGDMQVKLNAVPILHGISDQLKSVMNRKTIMQVAQSEPGSELLQNTLKLGAVSMITHYAQKNMRNSSWKKKLIGLAIIYVAPIVLKYVREKLDEYQRNKTASSMEKLI